MPYTHFHNWSFHTHHQRPKGGPHDRAVRRRQRPWKIGFFVALVVSLLWFSYVSGWYNRFLDTGAARESNDGSSVGAREVGHNLGLDARGLQFNVSVRTIRRRFNPVLDGLRGISPDGPFPGFIAHRDLCLT